MKKQAASLILVSQLLALTGPALAAERYTQVFGVPYTQYTQTTENSAPISQPLPVQITKTQQPQLAQASATLQTPEEILAHLEEANKVPDSIRPTFKVEHSSTLNAETDGQNLIITDALLSKLNTNDERAFVISHELSHILLSHIAKTQLRRTGLSLLDNFLIQRVGQNSLLGLASELGINLVDLKSSRVYEYQADDLGVKLMTNAGYDPQAAIQVFEILEANTPASNTPGFLQNHPITKDRIRALVQKYKLSIN